MKFKLPLDPFALLLLPAIADPIRAIEGGIHADEVPDPAGATIRNRLIARAKATSDSDHARKGGFELKRDRAGRSGMDARRGRDGTIQGDQGGEVDVAIGNSPEG